jgi:beta-galactosidase
MIPHSRGVRSRIYREIVDLGQELRCLPTFDTATVCADTAILFDWESWWALELDPRPTEHLKYLEQVKRFYRALYFANTPVDFRHPRDNLSSYKVVLAPVLWLVTKEAAENIRRYVSNGGTLLVTFASGIVDDTGSLVSGGYPGPLGEVLGLEVEEPDPLPAGSGNRMRMVGSFRRIGKEFCCGLWCDRVLLDGAEAIAEFIEDYHAGYPAATIHRYGEGYAYYIATEPEARFLKRFLRQVGRQAGITPPITAGEGIEISRLQVGNREILFILNHSIKAVRTRIPRGSFRDLIHDSVLRGTVRIQPRDVVVLTRL